MILERGRSVLHFRREARLALVHRWGFVSGRPRDKRAGVPHRLGRLGAPVLDDCYAHFECRVANVMDTGSSTCFLGDVVAVGHGAADRPSGIVMRSEEHTSELQSLAYLVCRLLLEKKKKNSHGSLHTESNLLLP